VAGRLRGLIVVAALAALAGCGSSPATQGISVHVDTNPFRISVLDNGKTVVSEDKVARLRYAISPTNDEFTLTKVLSSKGTPSSGAVYRVATTEPGRTATVSVATTPTGASISVSLSPTTNVMAVYDAFDTGPDEHFLGGGEKGNQVDLRGQILPIQVGYLCSSIPIPFFASSAGWGLRIASQHTGALAFPGSTGGSGCQVAQSLPCSFSPLTDRAEVCLQGSQLTERIYVGSLQQSLDDYQAETGEPAVPPPSELELIKWRDVVNGPADVLEDVTRLQAARIPIGWVLVDNPWESCPNGGLAFDETTFPDPAGLISAVHARGVKFMLWVSPRATCPGGYPGATLGEPPVLDLRNPAVVSEYQARIRKLVALGIDGVKADRGDENDLTPVSQTLTNDYPLLFAKAVMDALPKGAAAIFRAGTVGSQSVVPGIWAGDQPQEYVGLQRAIVSAQTAAMSGFPTWGSDVGGYAGPPYDDAELFVRWAQLGAVSPVMEVGGMGTNATPWLLGPAAMSGLRAAATLHYELFPTFYSLLTRHQPVIRPLAFAYPNDPTAWSTNYEFLVGPDLLAAPVTGQGGTPSVYLPAGTWVDLYTGASVRGGNSFTRATPLDQFPFYVRAGTVVPFNLRASFGSWWGVDELTHAGRAGFLATNGATLALRGQPANVQIFVPAARRPAHVTIGGEAVQWRWNSGPLPGVVVRLHGPVVTGHIALSNT
jgi:alpha-D-xyloside xylohydrolase